MLLNEIGQRIRKQRERLGLKQVDVANALQISPQAVSKWERGENAPDIAILAPLSRLLGVSVDWLLDAQHEARDVFEATVFATSVNGAYEKSLKMAPREFAAWANGFFHQLTESVLRHEGVPIKYIGDGFLAFFSGKDHPRRALEAALLSRTLVSEDLKIGLNAGDIYLGAIGHPDYALPDIMSEAVNITFLTMNWADKHAASGIAGTADFVERVRDRVDVGTTDEVIFKDTASPIAVCEILKIWD